MVPSSHHHENLEVVKVRNAQMQIPLKNYGQTLIRSLKSIIELQGTLPIEVKYSNKNLKKLF